MVKTPVPMMLPMTRAVADGRPKARARSVAGEAGVARLWVWLLSSRRSPFSTHLLSRALVGRVLRWPSSDEAIGSQQGRKALSAAPMVTLPVLPQGRSGDRAPGGGLVLPAVEGVSTDLPFGFPCPMDRSPTSWRT